MGREPDDDDGKSLQWIADAGVDLTIPHGIEFPIDSYDEKTSENIQTKLAQEGYEITEVYFDPGKLEGGEELTEENREFWPSWTVHVKIIMIPDYDRIVKVQDDLNRILIPLGVKSEGWGLLH